MTPDQLAMLVSRKRADRFHAALHHTMQRYDITTPLRQAHFLAQILHETGGLRYMAELWGPTEAQRRYEPPSRLARVLGNTEPGDGRRFRGRGMIQLTGRANYQRYADFLTEETRKLTPPDWPQPKKYTPTDVSLLLSTLPEYQADVAGWFWDTHHINELADLDLIKPITRTINGGLNGLESRMDYFQRAQNVLQ